MVKKMLILVAVGLFVFLSPTRAQSLLDPLVPASTGGLAALDQALARLSSHQRLLVVGAHPDDEDSTLLAHVARGEGGEAAYLSLNRGEGGQNLIGSELGVGLGLIRAHELLAARRIDGARQYFTRAYDFGYTRSLEETFQRWPRELLEKDVLRVIRHFRPQVMVSVFPPSARAGHGQHQAAGVLAAELFPLAGDLEAAPSLLEEGLFPWQPEALYRSGFFDRESEAVKIPMGAINPMDGRSIRQLAQASRSSHRSQDMGSLQEPGSWSHRLIPVAGAATTQGTSPFSGIDTSLPALAAVLGDDSRREKIETYLEQVEELAKSARQELSPVRLSEAAEKLAQMVRLLKATRAVLGPEPDPASAASAVAALVEEKWQLCQEALMVASGLVPDTFSDRDSWVPGESGKVTVRLWNSSSGAVSVQRAALRTLPHWQALPLTKTEFPYRLEGGELGEWEFEVQVPPNAKASWPYFLRQPLLGDIYDWGAVESETRGQPFAAPLLAADLKVTVLGEEASLSREVVHRYRDQARGEIRQPLRVVPAIEVAVEPRLVVLATSGPVLPPLEVRLTHHKNGASQGELRVTGPPSWPSIPAQPFELRGAGSQVVLRVPLEPPADLGKGESRFSFVAVVGEESFHQSAPVVSYPHIRTTQFPREAELVVRSDDLLLPELTRVGYIRGASDRVPEALLQVGVPLEVLSNEVLAVGDLTVFDVIVVGSRAYETDPALGQVNDRLLDYARAGGTLVVQYQQYQFVRGGFAPYPLEIGRPHGRVTDESAPVALLQPGHSILQGPNPLGQSDWDAWVQERGLYFPETWHEAYTPLLSMADPGGSEQRGSLLVASLGEGTYVYTGLAFFRQLPAGVPGAFRLFLNILALGS
ncbi:MAG: PIG-L family deacetylase [Deltaproteobacteria bacterium]|nr:PIG-L family deacetylase [Deltaproteobacteria bacterium]